MGSIQDQTKSCACVQNDVCAYERFLISHEKAPSTIEKYVRDIRAFIEWLGERNTTVDTVGSDDIRAWKEFLLEQGYAHITVNAKLAALNGYLSFCGRGDLHARFLKIQRKVFRDPSKDLTRTDYRRLVEVAQHAGKEMIALIMESICATGMRVSEVRYLTVDAVEAGCVEVSLKGKVRFILIPKKLKVKLLAYIRKRHIEKGPIFLSKSGKVVSRYNIWAQMKTLSKEAKVAASKVFPHNLRHLFACAFYHATKDIARLADVLGHSSIETTRVYLMTTGIEHARLIEGLGLVI